MNLLRVVLAAVAALIAYFAVGSVFFAVPGMRAEFEKHPGIYRTGDAINSVMAVGMFGLLLAIGVATVLFAALHPAGAGIGAGLAFGVGLALFQCGAFVLHNHMMLNVSARLSAFQALAYSVEWLTVGVVIGLVY